MPAKVSFKVLISLLNKTRSLYTELAATEAYLAEERYLHNAHY